MSRRSTRARTRPARQAKPLDHPSPVREHLRELRLRATVVAATVLAGSLLAYGFERRLITLLLRPSHGQQFIYTSPLGGINFIFSTCLYLGVILASPVLVYEVLAFIRPLIHSVSQRFVLGSAVAVLVVAIGGVLFGYFIGLPTALHFLLHQFVSVQVKPLITIQAYMSFVGVYLLGSALMFQLPLLVLIINRIKPLTPSGLSKSERWVIVAAVIAAFIMNPTPNLLDQLTVVLPLVLMYQVSIGLVWLVNKRKPKRAHSDLYALDAERRAKRAATRQGSRAIPPVPLSPAPRTNPVAAGYQARDSAYSRRPLSIDVVRS